MRHGSPTRKTCCVQLCGATEKSLVFAPEMLTCDARHGPNSSVETVTVNGPDVPPTGVSGSGSGANVNVRLGSHSFT